MSNEPYDGYTNWETWSVALIIDNDQLLQAYWLDQASQELQYALDHGSTSEYWSIKESAIYALAKSIREEIADQWDNVQFESVYALLFQQLMDGSLDEVNYDELATGYIEQAIETDGYCPRGWDKIEADEKLATAN